MKPINKLIILATTLIISITSYAFILPSNKAGETLTTLAPIVQNARPAVVSVYITGELPNTGIAVDPFNNPFFGFGGPRPETRRFQSGGSGVIIDSNEGIIITNAHLFQETQNASNLSITVNVTSVNGVSRNHKAKLIGSDEAIDIAVLKIETDGLTDLPYGDSDQVQVGDFVLAIGSPFDLNQTVTSGIVSGLSRGLGGLGVENFIQTDAAINPGNSGGALINLNGELIGINTAILSTQGGGNIGIGFAVPINMVRTVVNQLLEYGEVQRGVLGVIIQELTPDLALVFDLPETQQGVLVAEVVPNSSAAKAGVLPGDIVTAINGDTVRSTTELRNIVSLTPIGGVLKLEVLRDNQAVKLEATIEAPAGQQLQQRPLAVEKTTDETPDQGPLQGLTLRESELLKSGVFLKGLEVSAIDENSPALTQNIRPGDIVIGVRVGDTQLAGNDLTLMRLQEVLSTIANDTPVGLRIHRPSAQTDFFTTLK